jgi:cytidyltransferase-like protein
MSLSKKDITVLLRTSVAGTPICLVEIRLLDTKDRKERLLAFVPGDPYDMGIDQIFDRRISRLTYVMDIVAGLAKIADVGTNPDFQHYHLQQSLFAYALKDMLANGIKTAGLRWKGGKAAYELYSKLGFRIIDKETKDMELSLSEYLVRKIYVRIEEEREAALKKANKADPPERKAIFTGDFDPFHSGHAYAIEKGLEFADKVLVYVTDRKGQFADVKVRKGLIRKYILLKGLEERVRVYDGVKKSPQLVREGYTTKICGSDLFAYPPLAPRHPEPVMAAQELVILTRPMHTHPPLIAQIKEHFKKSCKPFHIIPSKGELGDISAEGVRRRIRSGDKITGLVPPEIEEDILKVYRPMWAGRK